MQGAIVYKNLSHRHVCHIGVGLAAYLNEKVLRSHGIKFFPASVRHNIDIVNLILGHPKLTHLVISAPWLSTHDLTCLLKAFPRIQFAVICHSNVGFLQADVNGTRNLRDDIELARQYPNLTVGGNSRKFVDWLRVAYNFPQAVLLPNLYPLGSVPEQKHPGHTLHIGCFGAVRPLKNTITAAAAALALARRFGKQVEFHISSGRDETHEGQQILNAIHQMVDGIPEFHLVSRSWMNWDFFQHVVRKMDLLMQPSFTESFNIVTADGIANGTPSVVSPAIDWVPDSWKADPDDALEIAEVGARLIEHHSIAREGYFRLQEHNIVGVEHWKRFVDKHDLA
jgi:hypothetical protein